MESIKETLSVGELAGQDYRKADVFRKYGIDFCCGGGQTVAEAARAAGIQEGELWSALQAAESSVARPGEDFNEWSVDRLINHIVRTHHAYIRETMPVLLEYARKVADHHGQKFPELVSLDMAVRCEAQDLLEHLEKEERVLFPAIIRLEETLSAASCQNLGFVEHAVERMMAEHISTGDSLEKFRALTGNYNPPPGACNSFRFLYEKLREFDHDLQQHIHLENNILFPKALALLKA